MGREGMNGRGPRSPRMHAWHSMALACGDVRVHTRARFCPPALSPHWPAYPSLHCPLLLPLRPANPYPLHYLPPSPLPGVCSSSLATPFISSGSPPQAHPAPLTPQGPASPPSHPAPLTPQGPASPPSHPAPLTLLRRLLVFPRGQKNDGMHVSVYLDAPEAEYTPPQVWHNCVGGRYGNNVGVSGP